MESAAVSPETYISNHARMESEFELKKNDEVVKDIESSEPPDPSKTIATSDLMAMESTGMEATGI